MGSECVLLVYVGLCESSPPQMLAENATLAVALTYNTTSAFLAPQSANRYLALCLAAVLFLVGEAVLLSLVALLLVTTVKLYATMHMFLRFIATTAPYMLTGDSLRLGDLLQSPAWDRGLCRVSGLLENCGVCCRS